MEGAKEDGRQDVAEGRERFHGFLGFREKNGDVNWGTVKSTKEREKRKEGWERWPGGEFLGDGGHLRTCGEGAGRARLGGEWESSGAEDFRVAKKEGI